MSLEQNLNRVIEAADRLTEVVGTKIRDIDNKVGECVAQFNQWRADREIVGPVDGFGTMRMNIFQGFIDNTTDHTHRGGGDFLGKTVNLGTSGNVYLHFKTPLNINNNNEMFWFNIRGYSYGSALALDEVFAGYCYAVSRALINNTTFGKANPHIYVDENGNIVLRVQPPNIYYTTIRIDTMRVGNGRLFQSGDLKEVRISLAEKVNFN